MLDEVGQSKTTSGLIASNSKNMKSTVGLRPFCGFQFFDSAISFGWGFCLNNSSSSSLGEETPSQTLVTHGDQPFPVHSLLAEIASCYLEPPPSMVSSSHLSSKQGFHPMLLTHPQICLINLSLTVPLSWQHLPSRPHPTTGWGLQQMPPHLLGFAVGICSGQASK